MIQQECPGTASISVETMSQMGLECKTSRANNGRFFFVHFIEETMMMMQQLCDFQKSVLVSSANVTHDHADSKRFFFCKIIALCNVAERSDGVVRMMYASREERES